jgi:hypothetical protein
LAPRSAGARTDGRKNLLGHAIATRWRHRGKKATIQKKKHMRKKLYMQTMYLHVSRSYATYGVFKAKQSNKLT